MPAINLMFVPTLLLALALFAVGRHLALRAADGRVALLWLAAGIVASVPGTLFAVYYAHLLDQTGWFYTFRALPFTELAAAGLGLLAGTTAGLLGRSERIRSSRLFTWIGPCLLLFFLVLALAVPYAKPFIAPLKVAFQDHWSEGVCLQTTPSTCGPSSAATLLESRGVHATERELARECYTCGSGTENWYLVRSLRRRGMEAEVRLTAPDPAALPFPSIAGTQCGGQGGAGHFIAILAEKNGLYTIGDPIGGRWIGTAQQLQARYYLTGFFLTVRPR